MKPDRINLLFIVNSLGIGGAEKQVISLANQLDPARFRLAMIYLKQDDALLAQIDLQQLDGGLLHADVCRRIDVAALRRIAALVRENAIDLIVCVNTFSLLYGHLARMIAGSRCRIVELFHSTLLGSLREKLQMGFYRPFIARTDMLVYVCANQQRYWRARLLRARQDTVIHNGIDVDYFRDRDTPADKKLGRARYGFAADDYVIGLCAAMRPEKAHADLLAALVRLRMAGQRVKALFIGDGLRRDAIERQIAALDLERQVTITGYLADVRPAIALCDAMAIVSHSVETFSIAALEAMAMGKPMIMSDIGGANEQVRPGENGYLFPAGDIGRLADAIHRLGEPGQARRFGLRARERVVEAYSLPVMVEAYARLFMQLVEGRVADPESRHAA
jgi:glycosyltransferase involved in cell wall biosynthesis